MRAGGHNAKLSKQSEMGISLSARFPQRLYASGRRSAVTARAQDRRIRKSDTAALFKKKTERNFRDGRALVQALGRVGRPSLHRRPRLQPGRGCAPPPRRHGASPVPLFSRGLRHVELRPRGRAVRGFAACFDAGDPEAGSRIRRRPIPPQGQPHATHRSGQVAQAALAESLGECGRREIDGGCVCCVGEGAARLTRGAQTGRSVRRLP